MEKIKEDLYHVQTKPYFYCERIVNFMNCRTIENIFQWLKKTESL
jgi:hypothetical protein